MNNKKRLEVYMNDAHVGTLAETANHLAAFEYSPNWIASGFSISPLSLPLRSGVFVPKGYEPFDGLFGVFADSLPDGWGRLLVDRMLQKKHINIEETSSITRLAIVDSNGSGALEYRPGVDIETDFAQIGLDELASECRRLFATNSSKQLDELFRLGGSSGGARPKINYGIDGEEWIVKFPSSADSENVGVQEYEYSLCAKKCGIEMSETRLLPSDICGGFFATKRFDRMDGRKIHMVSAGGLLETSHRIPNLDYNILMQLTFKLTHSFAEAEKLFRLMCFNVFAHNRDDHSKNFSYLCEDGVWRLSPAYDLTYSNSIGGEHATTVNGNGENPGMADILEVAKKAKLDEKKAEKIALKIREKVTSNLNSFIPSA